jgi:hypothetical protein
MRRRQTRRRTTRRLRLTRPERPSIVGELAGLQKTRKDQPKAGQKEIPSYLSRSSVALRRIEAPEGTKPEPE